MKKNLSKKDSIQSYILIGVAIICIIVGLLLIFSKITLSNFILTATQFGIIMLILGVLSIFYAIFIIMKVNKNNQ